MLTGEPTQHIPPRREDNCAGVQTIQHI